MNSTTQHKLTPKGDRTRGRIVTAAAELMLEDGVAGTTIDDVKTRARVSSSQLYHYFSDKNDLVRAVIDEQTESVVGKAEVVFAQLDSMAALRAWRDRIVDIQDRKDFVGGCPVGSLGSELAELDVEAREHLMGSFARWETAIRGGLRAMYDRGELAAGADPDALALALLTALQGGLLLSKIQRSSRALEAGLDAILTLIGSHVG